MYLRILNYIWYGNQGGVKIQKEREIIRYKKLAEIFRKIMLSFIYPPFLVGFVGIF